jgi:hypothetical protein
MKKLLLKDFEVIKRLVPNNGVLVEMMFYRYGNYGVYQSLKGNWHISYKTGDTWEVLCKTTSRARGFNSVADTLDTIARFPETIPKEHIIALNRNK